MNNIIPFDFEGSSIRLLDLEGSPWFVAMEIASILDYSDAFEMTKRLDEDEKQNRQIDGFVPRGVTLINESGLYSAILGSRKPEAAKFKKWVTAEVLPAIRKTGSYTAPKAAPSPVRLAYDAAKAFPPLFRVARLLGCDKNAAAISANQMVTKLTDVNLMAGLGQVHLVAEKQDTQFFTPTELGKRIGTSARGVNLLLAEAGVQMKRGDVWEVTDSGREFARILDTGKRHGSGVPIQQIKWSPGVLPLLGIEKEAA